MSTRTKSFDYAVSLDPTWDARSDRGGGVIAGFSPPQNKHEYTGSVSGTSTGSSVNATEFVDFTIPCPGAKMQIGYSGSK